MKLKRIFNLCLSTAICFTLFTGCGNTKSSISADLSYTQSDIGTISVSSDVQIVGLGEASHGVAQYHQMKLDVFKLLDTLMEITLVGMIFGVMVLID